MTERELALNYLDETRDKLLARVRSLSPQQAERCARDGGWAIAGILEHIVIIEGVALNRIRRAAEKPADPSLKSVMAGKDEALVRQVAMRTSRISAPPFGYPVGGQSLEALTERFASARADTRDSHRLREEDLRKHFAIHPMLGALDCHQWLLLIGAHGERHRAQIEEILAET